MKPFNAWARELADSIREKEQGVEIKPEDTCTHEVFGLPFKVATREECEAGSMTPLTEALKRVESGKVWGENTPPEKFDLSWFDVRLDDICCNRSLVSEISKVDISGYRTLYPVGIHIEVLNTGLIEMLKKFTKENMIVEVLRVENYTTTLRRVK